MLNSGRRNFLKDAMLSTAGIMALPGEPMHAPGGKNNWKCALTLDKNRKVIAGSNDQLTAAIRKGADLRIYTEFRHNEHIDTSSTNPELIKEVADFRVTYLVDHHWVAGMINLRQPIELPDGFGPRPSMSFFMYNQDGEQAIARPYLDGQKATGKMGPGILDDHSAMPKYHQFDAWDTGTNAPSSNFVYDFETYKFWVSDTWEEVYANSMDGKTINGAVDALADAFTEGREVKVGISGLCDDMTEGQQANLPHEVFVQCGSCYYYTQAKQFSAASQPVIRVEARIPMRYKSREWDFGWLMVRSDGHVARWLVDPYTLQFHRSNGNYAMRWLVR